MDNSLQSELDNSIRCFYDILSKLKDVDKYLEDNGICVQCRNPLYDGFCKCGENKKSSNLKKLLNSLKSLHAINLHEPDFESNFAKHFTGIFYYFDKLKNGENNEN